jgi:hypothetical protein
MRTTRSFTRWAFCALALSCAASVAVADSKTAKSEARPKTEGKTVTVKSKKSLAACTSFDQLDKDDDLVELTVHNACSVPIDCVISWRLVCAPESKTRRTVHAGSANLALVDATSQSAQASAAACKDDSWLLDQVRWSCQPNQQ